MTLDARTEAVVQRWVDEAPPLSERQADLIATVFQGEPIEAIGDESQPSR